MASKPFHHGNLRAVLLDLTTESLRSGGLDRLSMRELARQAGVTNAAPRRHFPDRHSLLDAVAADGFRRLTARMTAAADSADDNAGDAVHKPDVSYAARFRSVAEVFVSFATEEAALLELMFSAKDADRSEELRAEAARFFAANEAFYERAPQSHARSSEDAARRQRLLVPTLQGIAALAAANRIDSEQVNMLLDDATALFA